MRILRPDWRRPGCRHPRIRWSERPGCGANHDPVVNDEVGGQTVQRCRTVLPLPTQPALAAVQVPDFRRRGRSLRERRLQRNVADGGRDERGVLPVQERIRYRARSRSHQAILMLRRVWPLWRRLRSDDDGVWPEVLRQIQNGLLHGDEDADWFLRNRNGWLAYVNGIRSCAGPQSLRPGEEGPCRFLQSNRWKYAGVSLGNLVGTVTCRYGETNYIELSGQHFRPEDA